MRQWSVIGMDLAAIRHLVPPDFVEAPFTRPEFEHVVGQVNAGQIYRGKPTPEIFHFRLNSGLHSACYLNCSFVLTESNLCSILAQQLIQICGVRIGDVEVVACSAMASIPLGVEVARQLRCRAVYVEKGQGKALETFRFIVQPGERVLVINELMTTGSGTTWDTKRLVMEQNPFPVEFLPFAGVMVSRSQDRTLSDGTPVKHVFHFDDFPTYGADCPFCAAGSELITGGKKDWVKLLQSRKV